MKVRPICILRNTTNWPEAGIPGLTGYELCIQLTRGCLSLIDAEDLVALSSTSWRASLSSNSHQVKAVRHSTPDEHGKRHPVYMHRQLMNPTADQQVDHRDQHRFLVYRIVDNRRQNLRNVTCSQNHSNSRPQVGCTSRYKGVCWDKRREKWRAYVKVNYRRIHLGYFDNEVEAAHAYNQAHQLHWPGIQEGLNRTLYPNDF